jgi:hypothetical protein
MRDAPRVAAMNKKTLITMWATLALLFLTWLFPLRYERGHWADINRYDHWVPWQYYFSWYEDSNLGKDDYKRTLLMDTIIVLTGVGLMVTFWRKPRKP